MPASATITEQNASPALAGTAIGEADLAQIVVAFNEATGKLQSAHEALRAEVARLKAELREANAQVERSGRLAALGEMAAGIAHEVRNPLGSIRLYAGMLEEDLSDRPRERELASKIKRSVRGLDAVVGDVLAFSREMRVGLEETDATSLLDRAMEECAPSAAVTASGRPITIRRADRERAPVAVECDAGLVHRALVNVVRNAIEAVAEEGSRAPHEVLLDAGERVVLESGGGVRRMVAVIVRDTGPGVPADVMAKMFNPFFTTRATGTGLGLAIVHRTMDAHGGRVSVRNHGAGAVVELMFPIRGEGPAAGSSSGGAGQEAT